MKYKEGTKIPPQSLKDFLRTRQDSAQKAAQRITTGVKK